MQHYAINDFKKLVFILVMISALNILTACDDEQGYSQEEIMITDPTFITKDNSYPEFGGIDTENEDDYSNIEAYTEFSEYPKDVESIKCIIKNNNSGKGFYFFPIPFIEYMNGNEWIRLDFHSTSLSYDSRWAYCAIEGNTTKPNTTLVIFHSNYLEEKLIIGEYRLVVFVGDKVVYAPFKIIN